MSLGLLKRAFMLPLLLVAVLSPLAQFLRTQQPWTCFMLTLDESYFVQATRNWTLGNGFKLNGELKPFDPGLSVGLPFAWGLRIFHKLSHLDWPLAGRFFVHSCFYLFLTSIVFMTWKRSRSFLAALVALALYGFAISHVPFGGYIAFGILGEIPGALFGLAALLALDRKRPVWAGALASVAFITKPTYLFLIPAVCVVSIIYFGKRGLLTWITSGSALLAQILFLAHARSETVTEYLKAFMHFAQSDSLMNDTQVLLDYFRIAGPTVAVLTFVIFFVGIVGLILTVSKKHSVLSHALGFDRFSYSASEMGSWLFLVIAILFYLVTQRKPLEKHWLVFYNLAIALFSVRVGIAVAPLVDALSDRVLITEQTSIAVTLGVLLTWLINVPLLNRKNFYNTPVDQCTYKEQRYLDGRLSEMKAKGQITPENLLLVIDLPHYLFLYELGFNPSYKLGWPEDPKTLPRWVVGSLPMTLPAPPQCVSEWKGSGLALFQCSH